MKIIGFCFGLIAVIFAVSVWIARDINFDCDPFFSEEDEE